eukprot:TRINITY_DN4060_c0_g1_i1.p1 TRINITY_DN4060_c0_g1~~TRINITY_DN4060_c0_g1_i1.p1  ORF type:complete len:473 (+),score=195.37 TRINITY_DN4060_c0_g1_i1:39-1457(+)
MVDIKAKEKLRNKVNKVVEQRMKATGAKDEKLVRIEINKEMRAKKKEKKASNHEEVEKIKIEVMKTMAGKGKKVIDKAVNKAIAKYYSKLKKSKNPQIILKQKANELIVDVNSQLWCPSDQGWWDEECQLKFEEVELLAAMWEINLLKAPQNFGKLYPAVCKKYFDFLAKKRFNSTTESEDKNTADKVKKSKSALQKKFEEKKAQNTDPQKNDKDILKEVLDEMNKKEKDANLKNLKQFWKPAHKPFFDQDCRDAYEKISEQAVKMGYDLDSKVGDFKKFKNKNKEECTNYFQLLETKRTGFNAKQKTKLEEKAKSAVKKDDESQAVEVDGNSNKKTKFSEDGDVSEESPKKKVKIETEADVDETIEKVDKELNKERRKQAKLAKKLKLKAKKEEEGGEEESAKLETTDETPIKKKAPFWKNKKVDGGVEETILDTVAKNTEAADESATKTSDTAALDVSTVKKSKKKKLKE